MDRVFAVQSVYGFTYRNILWGPTWKLLDRRRLCGRRWVFACNEPRFFILRIVEDSCGQTVGGAFWLPLRPNSGWRILMNTGTKWWVAYFDDTFVQKAVRALGFVGTMIRFIVKNLLFETQCVTCRFAYIPVGFFATKTFQQEVRNDFINALKGFRFVFGWQQIFPADENISFHLPRVDRYASLGSDSKTWERMEVVSRELSDYNLKRIPGKLSNKFPTGHWEGLLHETRNHLEICLQVLEPTNRGRVFCICGSHLELPVVSRNLENLRVLRGDTHYVCVTVELWVTFPWLDASNPCLWRELEVFSCW